MSIRSINPRHETLSRGSWPWVNVAVRLQGKRMRAGEVLIYFSFYLSSLRNMSHISCMLCGLQRPVSNYDPSNYDNELYLITKRSKGYRGGFDNDFEPILGDDVYTPLIKNRILEIVRAFKEKGIISEKELAGLIPKTDVTESWFDKAISTMLYNALTGTSEDSESKAKELSELVDKLKTDYSKRDNDYKELSQKQSKFNLDYINKILLKDLLNYTLMHFIKYCDAQIGGSYLYDFKVFLTSLNNDSMTLLVCLYQDLTIEEWCSLMDKIQGTSRVQKFLDYYTMLKKAEVDREYNKIHLFNNLWMFRRLKLSSWN